MTPGEVYNSTPTIFFLKICQARILKTTISLWQIRPMVSLTSEVKLFFIKVSSHLSWFFFSTYNNSKFYSNLP